MAKHCLHALAVCLVLLFVQADEWSDEESQESAEGRSLTISDRMAIDDEEIIREQMREVIIPISANISMGTHDNAQTLGLQLGPEGVSVSHSNTYSHALPNKNGSKITGSRSSSFAAGVDGLSGALAKVTGNNNGKHGNDFDAEMKTFSHGNASASSYGGMKNGLAGTGVKSSIGNVKSQAATGAGSNIPPRRPPPQRDVPVREKPVPRPIPVQRPDHPSQPHSHNSYPGKVQRPIGGSDSNNSSLVRYKYFSFASKYFYLQYY